MPRVRSHPAISPRSANRSKAIVQRLLLVIAAATAFPGCPSDFTGEFLTGVAPYMNELRRIVERGEGCVTPLTKATDAAQQIADQCRDPGTLVCSQNGTPYYACSFHRYAPLYACATPCPAGIGFPSYPYP